MNPSASGWVSKLGQLLVENASRYSAFAPLYAELKQTGFVYGVHVAPLPFVESVHPLTEDEIAKVNHLSALYYAFVLQTKNNSFEEFVSTLFGFYMEMGLATSSQTKKILEGKQNGV